MPRADDVLEITVADLRATIRKAERTAYARGRDEVLGGLRAVAKLNGSAGAVLKSVGDPESRSGISRPDDDTADPHQSLYEALLGAVIDAREAGDDGAVAGLVAAYRDHLDDPDLLASALAGAGDGETVAKAIGRVFLKAGNWKSEKHPRDKNGRFIAVGRIAAAANDPAKAAELRKEVAPEDAGKLEAALEDPAGTVGRTKRGEARHAATQRREKRAADHKRAGELADKIAGGEATYEELHELGDHLERLTLDKLRYLQARIPTEGRGRRKAEVVAALRQSLDERRKAVHGAELAPPEPTAAEPAPADDPKTAVLRQFMTDYLAANPSATDDEVLGVFARGPGAGAARTVLGQVRGAGKPQHVSAVRVDHLGYNAGQHDFRATAEVKGEPAGYLDYSIYDGVISVKHVHVDPEHRRKGVATRMYDAVLAEHPDAKLGGAMRTEDGGAFRAAYDKKHPDRIAAPPKEPEVNHSHGPDEWAAVNAASRDADPETRAKLDALADRMNDWDSYADAGSWMSDTVPTRPNVAAELAAITGRGAGDDGRGGSGGTGATGGPAPGEGGAARRGDGTADSVPVRDGGVHARDAVPEVSGGGTGRQGNTRGSVNAKPLAPQSQEQPPAPAAVTPAAAPAPAGGSQEADPLAPARAHLATLPPDGPAARAIDAALANGGGDTRRTLKELGHRHAEMHGEMSPEEHAAYVDMMGRLGVKPLHAAGETKPFDPATMAGDAGLSTGAPVRVVRNGWSGLYGDAGVGHELVGNNWQRAKVEPVPPAPTPADREEAMAAAHRDRLLAEAHAPAPSPDDHDREQYNRAEAHRDRMEGWAADKPGSVAAELAAGAARGRVERLRKAVPGEPDPPPEEDVPE